MFGNYSYVPHSFPLFCLLFVFLCFTCPDETTNSAGSFEMIENLDQDSIKQDNDIDIKKGSSNGKCNCN